MSISRFFGYHHDLDCCIWVVYRAIEKVVQDCRIVGDPYICFHMHSRASLVPIRRASNRGVQKYLTLARQLPLFFYLNRDMKM